MIEIQETGLEFIRDGMRGLVPTKSDSGTPRQLTEPSVLIADDHAIFLEGLRLSLEAAGMRILGLAHNGHQALELSRLKEPDVLLTDLSMPGLSGLDLVPGLRRLPKPPKVALLTAQADSTVLDQAKSLGIDGLLSKDMDSASLAEALRMIARGIPVYQLTKFATAAANPRATPSGDPLSDQEVEVLRLITQALDNREIAAALVISENTVKTHVSNILTKLNVDNRTQAAMWALRNRVDPSHERKQTEGKE
ncbi:MAG: response regulator [Anaerolineales bacterium]